MHFNFSIKCEDCPIECEKHSYGRNVEYGKYHEPIYRTLDKYSQSTGNTGIDIAAFQVFFPELEMTVHHQKLDYTADQLFSELGGAAGLVLGLSLITIVRQIDDCISAMIKWAKKLRTKKSNGVNRSSQTMVMIMNPARPNIDIARVL